MKLEVLEDEEEEDEEDFNTYMKEQDEDDGESTNGRFSSYSSDWDKDVSSSEEEEEDDDWQIPQYDGINLEPIRPLRVEVVGVADNGDDIGWSTIDRRSPQTTKNCKCKRLVNPPPFPTSP